MTQNPNWMNQLGMNQFFDSFIVNNESESLG